MNKSKSCSNFSRRTLSESEKMLLNKYKNIDNDKNNNNDLKIKDYFAKRINYSIKEIENKLDNNYLDFTYTNNLTKKYLNETMPNNNNNTLKETSHKSINISEYTPSIDYFYYIDKTKDIESKPNYLENKINQKLINKYVDPDKIIDNITNNKNNLNNLNQTYKNSNAFVNFNYINLTENLFNKTQKMILKSNNKIDLKNNSCKNIFNFKRIAKKEFLETQKEIPNLIETSNFTIPKNSYKKNNESRKQARNLSEIKVVPKLKNKIFENKYRKNTNLKSCFNTIIIRPYKYISCEKIMFKNNKKKVKNKIIKKNKVNLSRTIDDININKNRIKNIKIHKYKDTNKIIKKENKENKENINENNNNKINKSSLIRYSSIMSQLIFKNKNY
jgi:hypothetical protein